MIIKDTFSANNDRFQAIIDHEDARDVEARTDGGDRYFAAYWRSTRVLLNADRLVLIGDDAEAARDLFDL